MDNNTSGQGRNATVPPEIDRWNWGAFLLTWIWGIGNNTVLSLLALVPVVNIVMPFVLGARGGAWAWRNRRWASVEEFQRVQRHWARWGLAAWAVFVVLCVGLLFAAAAWTRSSEVFVLSFERVQADADAVEMIGTPMETGWPSGKVEQSGATGTASLAYAVSGPRGKGTVYVEASRSLGQWQIDREVLEEAGTGRRLRLDDSDDDDGQDDDAAQPRTPADGNSTSTPSARALRTSATVL